MALLRHLARQGLRIIESPRDGHCLIHSICSSWLNQLSHFKPVDIDCVKSKIFIETVSNVNHYTLAVGPSILLEQQKSYLLHRNYDSDFGDALPLVLANALNIKLDILNETLHHGFDVVPVIPRCNAQASLTLHRQGDHYNGIGPIFGVDVQSPCEPCSDVAIPIRPRPTNGADPDGPNPTVPSTLDCHFSSQDDPSPDTATQNARRTYSAEFMRDINRSNICPLKRQTRKRLFKYRIWYNHVKHDCFSVDMNYPCCDPEPISVRINSDHHIRNKNKVPKFKALTRIERDNSFYVTQQVSHLRCALLNVRSLKNKCDVVSEYISDHNIDILCLTESWINDNISDLLCLQSATPSGYSFISVPRKSGRGGGLVLIYKSSIRVRLKPSLNNDSFESMLAEVVYDHIQMGMVLVYRPPSEKFSTFLTEFGQMVTHYSLKILAEFYAWVILTSMLIRRVICGQRHSTACSVRSVSFSMFVFRLMRKVIHSTWSWLMLDILHSYGNLVPHYKAMFKVTIIHYVLTSLVPNRINHPKSYSFVNGLIWIWNTSSRNFLLVWLTAQPQVMWILWWMCIIKLWNLVWMIYCQFGLKP